MASKTQSGQRFSARSMNGIIELDDGAGTLISGGVIQTNDINTANLTSDFITANNLLEANVNETITGKWTFTLPPYLTNYPTVSTDAVNKGFADATYAGISALADYLLISVATSTYQTLAGMALYLTIANASATYQTIANMANYVGLTGTQTITGTKTFSNVFMGGGYIPVSARQLATKEYVDAIGAPTIESVLQQGNNANGETMTGLSNLTMNAGYTPNLDLEVSTKNYSDVFTGKIDATNNSFFTSVQFFNAPFQRTGTTTIPVGTYTIQSLLTQIATSLQQTFSADVPPSVVLTEWIFDPTTNKVSARLPNNTIIPELEHRIDPLLQLLGFQGARPLQALLHLGRTSPATPADHPQHLPYVKQYVDDNFVAITGFQTITGQKTFTSRQAFTTTTDMEDILMNSTYTPTTAYQVATKKYVDDNFVGILGTQTIQGTKTFANAFMAGSYTPASAFQIATKGYVDGVVAGGGMTEALFFDSNGNSRFQKITGATPPTPMYGYNNTTIGFESAKQMPTDILTGRNTFLGFRAGWYFGQGFAGSTDNTFLGHLAGWNGVNAGYGFNRTTCVGYRSYADKSDQVALGDGNGEIRARGSLLVDGWATFNGSGAGLIVNTISSFRESIYRKIGNISYEVIDQLSILAYQTIANLATSYISNNTTYFSTKYIYDNFYTQSFSLATFFQIAGIQSNYDLTPSNSECYSTSFLNPHIDAITKRTPKILSAWRYNTNNSTNLTTLTFWSNGAIAFSHNLPLPSNTGSSTFTLGDQVPAGTEDINQMSQYGTWTANVDGMYQIDVVIQAYSSFTMSMYIEYFRNGLWGGASYFRSNLTQPVAGVSPYGVVCNYSGLVYLRGGASAEGLRIRSFAQGAQAYGYAYTDLRSTYLEITRTTGYT